MESELSAKSVTFLLKLHFNQITTSTALVSSLHKLRWLARTRLAQHRVCFSFPSLLHPPFIVIDFFFQLQIRLLQVFIIVLNTLF